MIGKRVSHFEIRERVGQGGMAAVYKAWDLRLKRHVALKVLHEDLARSGAKDWILHEAQAVSKLEHPHIATVYEVFEDENRTYLAMQLLEGGTLGDRIQEKGLPIIDAVRIALGVAKGLEEAHRSGVLHRDVKPQNVMFTRHGDVKLTDFGLAKETETDSTLTRTGVVRGTPAYLPPELLRGGRWDAQGDVYCAGAVLYEMLSGRRPFGETSPHQLFRAILNDEPPSISSLRPEVPRRLEGIAIRALEKSPTDRYPDASVLARDLEEVLRLLEEDTELPRGRRVVSRRVKRRRKWLAAGSAAILIVAAVGIIQHLVVQNTVAGTALAVVPLPSLTRDDSLNSWTRQVALMLTTDLGESSHIRVLGTAGLSMNLTNQGLDSTSEITADGLRKIANSASLSHIITLSCFQGRNTLRADLEIIDMTDGRTIATVSEEVADAASLMDMIDPLASKTRRSLLSNEQLATEQDRPFRDITSASREAVTLYYQAEDFFARNNSLRAIELLRQVLDLDPNFFLARQFLTFLLAGNNAYIKDVDLELLSEYEQLVHAYIEALAKGKFEEGLAAGERLLTLRPGNWVGLNAKYTSEFFLGHYALAAQTCEEAIRSGYRIYFEHLILNSAYGMMGLSGAEIVERYQQMLEEDPSDAMMRFWLGVTYLTLNRDAEAEGLFDSVFELYPDNDTLLRVVSNTYAWREGRDKSADYRIALAYLRRIAELFVSRIEDPESKPASPNDYDGLHRGVPFSFRKGEIYLLQGDLESAITSYERGLLLNPNHYNSFYRLGQAHDQLGNVNDALVNFQKYIDVSALAPYDAYAEGREDTCAATSVCHTISRPAALADASQRLARLRSGRGEEFRGGQ